MFIYYEYCDSIEKKLDCVEEKLIPIMSFNSIVCSCGTIIDNMRLDSGGKYMYQIIGMREKENVVLGAYNEMQDRDYAYEEFLLEPDAYYESVFRVNDPDRPIERIFRSLPDPSYRSHKVSKPSDKR